MTLSEAYKRATDAHSRYIRLSSVHDNGLGNCCTCGRTVHWKSADAGHFVKRGRKTLVIDDRNVHLQCRTCNRTRNGMEERHALYIDRRYGAGTADELRRLGRQATKRTVSEVLEMAHEYERKAKELEGKIHG